MCFYPRHHCLTPPGVRPCLHSGNWFHVPWRMAKNHTCVSPFQLPHALWERRSPGEFWLAEDEECHFLHGTYPFSQLFSLVQGDLWVMKEYHFSGLLGKHLSVNARSTSQNGGSTGNKTNPSFIQTNRCFSEFHTFVALLRSLENATPSFASFKASPTILACSNPIAFKAVSRWPWIIPSRFSCVSPWRTTYTRTTDSLDPRPPALLNPTAGISKTRFP